MHLLLRVGLCSIGGTLFATTAYITAITYAPAPAYTVSDAAREQKFEEIAPTYYNSTKNQEFYLGIRGMRKSMAKDARGTVLEIGAGTGTMVGLYPPTAKSHHADHDNNKNKNGDNSSEAQQARQTKIEERRKNDPLAGIVDPNAEKEMMKKQQQQTESSAPSSGGGYVSPGVTQVIMSDRATNMLQVLEEKIEGRIGYAPHRILEDEAKAWEASSSLDKHQSSANKSSPSSSSGERHPLYQTAHFASESIPFPDNSFDTVVDVFGLCSYDDPVKALMEMSRVCKPDGRLLLLEHGKGNWSRINMQLDKWAPRHAKSWGCWWNRDIRRYLRLAGLKVLRKEEKHFGTTQKMVVKPNKSWM